MPSLAQVEIGGIGEPQQQSLILKNKNSILVLRYIYIYIYIYKSINLSLYIFLKKIEKYIYSSSARCSTVFELNNCKPHNCKHVKNGGL